MEDLYPSIEGRKKESRETGGIIPLHPGSLHEKKNTETKNKERRKGGREKEKEGGRKRKREGERENLRKEKI